MPVFSPFAKFLVKEIKSDLESQVACRLLFNVKNVAFAWCKLTSTCREATVLWKGTCTFTCSANLSDLELPGHLAEGCVREL